MDHLQKIIEDIETHSVEGIKECFANGIDPNMYYKDEPLIYELTSEYARGPRFKECVKAFVDHGLVFEDKILLAVLSDNASDLDSELKKDPKSIEKKYSLRCAYTPLFEASLLHICAEFNHVSCAEILVKLDEHGIDELWRTDTHFSYRKSKHRSLCRYDELSFIKISRSEDHGGGLDLGEGL